MPSVSEAQKKFMAAAAHDPKFAKEADIDPKVAKEFNEADKAKEQLKSRKKFLSDWKKQTV